MSSEPRSGYAAGVSAGVMPSAAIATTVASGDAGSPNRAPIHDAGSTVIPLKRDSASAGRSEAICKEDLFALTEKLLRRCER